MTQRQQQQESSTQGPSTSEEQPSWFKTLQEKEYGFAGFKKPVDQEKTKLLGYFKGKLEASNTDMTLFLKQKGNKLFGTYLVAGSKGYDVEGTLSGLSFNLKTTAATKINVQIAGIFAEGKMSGALMNAKTKYTSQFALSYSKQKPARPNRSVIPPKPTGPRSNASVIPPKRQRPHASVIPPKPTGPRPNASVMKPPVRSKSDQATQKPVGQAWPKPKTFSGSSQGIGFMLNLQRHENGKITGTYKVNSGQPWKLEGELQSNGTLKLEASEVQASFTGAFDGQGKQLTLRFTKKKKDGEQLVIDKLVLQQMSKVDIQLPSAANRQKINVIPTGGYTKSERVRMKKGVEMGRFRGVPGYYNGLVEAHDWGNNKSENGKLYYGLKWQCVEYVRRFTHLNSGKYITHLGHAGTFYKSYLKDGGKTFDGLVQNRNLDLKTGKRTGSKNKPKIGDILVMKTTTFGHVAIVAGVTDANIIFVQQNVFSHFKGSLPFKKSKDKWVAGGNIVCWLSH